MSEQLKHIFDISKCPTKRQMQDYLKGVMQPEEIYAFEHHISSCMLCSEAMDGMMEHPQEALAGMTHLNDNFLKDHLELHPPHIHLNGIAVTNAADIKHKNKNTIPLWKPIGIAAALLLCLGLGWYVKNTTPFTGTHTPTTIAHAQEESGIENVPPSYQANPPDQKTPTTAPSAIHTVAEAPPTPDPLPMKTLAAAAFSADSAPQEPPREQLKKAPSLPLSATKETLATTPNPRDAASLSGSADVQQKEAETPMETAKVRAISSKTEATKKEQPHRNSETYDADELFEQGEYALALTAYKRQMNKGDEKSNAQAKLMAAHCYLHLGERKSARKLLTDLAENSNGAPKRRAKRLLKEMEQTD